MALTPTFQNVILTYVGTQIGKISLHSADPGTTGANELSGGTYARITPTWATVTTQDLHPSTSPLAFNVPAGSTVNYFGLWDSAGTTFRGSGAVQSATFTAAGTYNLSSSDIAATSSG